MAFELPPLPYATDALAPHMSEQTLNFHHGKHHQAYVTNLNGLVAGTELEGKSLEEVILAADPGPLFNNSAQVWNHTFFWNCMTPSGGGDPEGALKDAIEQSFGSVDTFKQTFADKAKTLFGSGWTWLVKGDNGLEIVQTKDADLPLKHGQTALLTVD
ncbi:MAG TPA: superoxide dismutase, partial [Acidimicrobiales bacterium]